MKRILFVITKANWGGAQRYVFDIATHLPSSYSVTVAHGEGSVLTEKLERAHIRTVRIPHLIRDMHIIKDVQAFFSLIKLFKKEKPDIVHLNSSKIGGLGALAARIVGIKKIVFTVHGFAFHENRPWLMRKIIACLSWLTVAFSTDVIFISKRDMDSASSWPFVKNKKCLIYNGIESPAFLNRLEARAELAEKAHVPASIFENRIVVGTIAELTPNKGHTYAIEALKRTPENVLYVVVGAGELLQEITQKINESSLNDRVLITGFVENAARYMNAFDIFLLPSLKEGLPYVLLEAGCARLAAVASNVGGIPDFLSHKNTGLIIPPHDSEAIAEALTSLSQNEILRTKLGDALYEKVAREYTLETMIGRTLALYERDAI